MKNLLYLNLTVFILFINFFSFAQVGINTTTPQDTLHVNGTLRVTNTNSNTPTKLMGQDDNGTLAEVGIGKNLELVDGTLNSSGSDYFVATIPMPQGFPNQAFNDINLGVNDINKGKTVFRLTGRNNNYELTGIAGGVDGRHIILFNVSVANFKIFNESTNSLPENRIITLSNNSVGTSGQGTAELVYDGTLQRWILFNFRD